MKHSPEQTRNAPDNGVPACDNGPVDIADIDERDIDLRIDMGSTEAVMWALQREMWPDLPIVLRLEWDGEPVSKARARFTNVGSKVRSYTPEKTRTAENRIITLARAEGLMGEPDASSTFGVFAKFFCGTWQRRDVDNMLKLVADALTGVVWKDDSQVSEMSASVQRGLDKDQARTHLLIYKTMAATHPSVKCPTCGVDVKQYRSSKKQHCSDDCRLAAKRLARRRTCQHCGIEWDPGKLTENKFCSTECYNLAHRVELICETCGVTFSRSRSTVRTHNYCSAECSASVRPPQRARRPKGVCTDCGEPVSKPDYGRCRPCWRIARSATSKGAPGINGNPKVGSIARDNAGVTVPYVTPKGRTVRELNEKGTP